MIGSQFYAGLLILLAVGWPLLTHGSLGDLAFALGVLNLGLFVFVWRSCSTPRCSYWRGLNIIAGSLMSGCANITILYAPAVLGVVYLISLVYAVRGFVDRERPAGPRWEALVLRFYERSVRGPAAS